MSYSNKLKILLDTVYLLPIVGIEVSGIERIMLILKRLREEKKATFCYTPFNIIEIINKLSKVRYDERRVYKGLLSIEENFELVVPTYAGYLKALELKAKGYRDLIDLLLYVTSLTRNVLFLTRDKELLNFLLKYGENTQNIILEEHLNSIE